MNTFVRVSILAAAIVAIATAQASADSPTTLRQAFAGTFEIGAAIPGPGLGDAANALLLANFTNVTSERCLKPLPTEPKEGVYTFQEGDALVAFARKNGLKVNGHTLVWHEDCPEWFFLDGDKPAGRDLLLKRMRDHIQTEASHFRGQVASWDVVNEALADGTSGFIRDSKWRQCLGEDYVVEAFLAAHKADPDVELYYNDYGIEAPVKRARALRLIHELKARHARIDGIGIQGHWSLDKVPFKDIEDSIVAFHAEGLKVMITELDLDVVPRKTSGAGVDQKESDKNDPYANGCPPDILKRQADQYRELFQLFEKHSDAVSRVTFWGLYDGVSWLNNWPRKRTNYPLLWDRALKPKPAFDAVISTSTIVR